MAESNVRYEERFPEEIVSERNKNPVAYLPIGTIEWHGEHNVVGLDAIKAHNMAIRCAKTSGGLVFPPLYYGEPREDGVMEFGGDENNRIKTRMQFPIEDMQPGYMDEGFTDSDIRYLRLLLHIMREIQSLGFKVIIVIAGHYGVYHHAKAAVELFQHLQEQPHGGMVGKAAAFATAGMELIRDDVMPTAGDHAAAWETSLMMVFRPECVDLSRLPEDPDAELIGVSGRDPRKNASREYGEEGIRLIVERITAKVEELHKGLQKP